MKLKIDISRHSQFTIWELGGWNPGYQFGTSSIIAGPKGEPLQVIYERDPTKNLLHFLFFAKTGMIAATCYVKQAPDGYAFTLSLGRITELRTELVQGQPRAKADVETLFACRKDVEDTTNLESLLDGVEFPASVPNARELMLHAINKALRPASDQKLFWGVARQTAEQ